jgi:hypothetical protein
LVAPRKLSTQSTAVLQQADNALKGDTMFKPRTLAIASSIAALSLAAAPFAQATSAHSKPASSARVDSSRDAKDIRHIDKSREVTSDKTSADFSQDVQDR